MTALCGGGTSAAKPGVIEKNIISMALIDGGLSVISPWLLIFAGFIDAFIFDTTAQCTSDPPAMPSSADLDPINIIGGILNPNHQVWLDAVNALLMNYFWRQFCECTSTSTPAATYPSAPAATTSPSGTTSSPCSDRTWQGVGESDAAGASDPFTSINRQLLPYSAFTTRSISGRSGQFSILSTPIPLQLVITQTYRSGGAGGFGVTTELYGYDGSGVQNINTSTGSIVQGAVTHTTNTFNIPAGTHDIMLNARSLNQSAPDLVYDVEVQVICSGQNTGGGPATPCGTDPAVLALLQQILSLLNSVYAGLPAPLTSYADGTAHTGLTGHGTITLAGAALAIRVDITADASNLGSEVGSPTMLFDRGFVVPIVNAAPVRGDVRLSYNPQTYVLPALTEQIGYSLHSGVTATITELTRGP